MGLTFEWTVKLGDLLTVGGALIVAAAFLYNRGGQEAGVKMTLEALAKDFTEMKSEFKQFGEIIGEVAVQKMQISLLMKWYDELRRGEGYVKGRTSIDGEYP